MYVISKEILAKNIPTLSECKKFLKITHSKDDDTIQNLLQAAISTIQIYLDQTLFLTKIHTRLNYDLKQKNRYINVFSRYKICKIIDVKINEQEFVIKNCAIKNYGVKKFSIKNYDTENRDKKVSAFKTFLLKNASQNSQDSFVLKFGEMIIPYGNYQINCENEMHSIIFEEIVLKQMCANFFKHNCDESENLQEHKSQACQNQVFKNDDADIAIDGNDLFNLIGSFEIDVTYLSGDVEFLDDDLKNAVLILLYERYYVRASCIIPESVRLILSKYREMRLA